MVTVTWITPFAPDRRGGGGQIRQAHLLSALAKVAQVTLICPGPVRDVEVLAAVSRLVEVAAPATDWRAQHRWLRRTADLAAALLSRPPLEVRAFGPVRRAVDSALREERSEADLVLVEFAGLAPLLPRGQKSPAWVLTLHNLPSRMAAQQAHLMTHRRQRWLLDRDAEVAAAFERRAVSAFDAVITCTEEDAVALGGLGKVLVVPNGTDAGRFRPTPVPADRRIVFTGALYTTPNVDGVRWFCQDVWPRIRSEEPSAVVDVVGARPTDEVFALGAIGGVRIHADVASVVPYLESARVAVVPLRVGSGTRLKALEALAAGRPVVGTTIGLEGLGLRPGEDVLVADDTASFAAAVLRLLRDDELAARLAASGRTTVERRFAWPAIAQTFAQSIVALATTGA